MAIVRTAKGTAFAYDGDVGVSGVTLSSVAIANGASIVVVVAAGAGQGVLSSATWNGQALTADLQFVNAGDVRILVLSKHNVTGATGDVVIEMTTSDTAAGVMCAAMEVTGLQTSASDTGASAEGTSTTPSSGATGTTAVADELLVGIVGLNAAGAAVGGTWDNSFSDGQSVSDGAAVALNEGYRIVAATGTYTASKTGATSGPWAAGIFTYKGASTAQTSTPDPVNSAGAVLAASGVPGPITSTPSPVDSVGGSPGASGVPGLRVVQPSPVASSGAVVMPITSNVADSYDPSAATSMADGQDIFILRGSGTLGDQNDATGDADAAPASWPTGTGTLVVSQNILSKLRPLWTISYVIFGARGVMTQDGDYLSNLRLDALGGSYALTGPWDDIRPYTVGAGSYIDRCKDARSAPVTAKPDGSPWTWLDVAAIPSASVKMDHANITTVGHFAEMYVTEVYVEAYGPQGSVPVPIVLRSRAGSPIRKTLVQVASAIVVLSGHTVSA